ncbi:MAG TPA: hypothetical protein DE045_04910 [Oceanospirillaceae bacterium]|nr:hypothetical protein [Oceanospirillaceae bacterium]
MLILRAPQYCFFEAVDRAKTNKIAYILIQAMDTNLVVLNLFQKLDTGLRRYDEIGGLVGRNVGLV